MGDIVKHYNVYKDKYNEYLDKLGKDKINEELKKNNYAPFTFNIFKSTLAKNECSKLCDGIEHIQNKNLAKIVSSILKDDVYPSQYSYIKDVDIGTVFLESIIRNYAHLEAFTRFNILSEDYIKLAIIDKINSRRDGYELEFMKDLVLKYDINSFQVATLLINNDLLNTMYNENRMNIEYKNTYTLLSNSIERYIHNLKRLINNNIDEKITTNSFSKLKDNYIFYTDIKRICEEYPNIDNYDLIRLVTNKNINNFTTLEKYLKLINNVDVVIKELFLNSFASIFADIDIFPSVKDDIMGNYLIVGFNNINGQSIKSEREGFEYSGFNIFSKNKLFFKLYNNFFEDNFNYDFLISIINLDNCENILKKIVDFKKEIIKDFETVCKEDIVRQQDVFTNSKKINKLIYKK